MIRKDDVAVAAPHYPNVAEVLPTVGIERADFHFVVRRHGHVPVEPALPAIRHGVGHSDIDDARPFPMTPPPLRRMESPQLLGPP